MGSVRVDKFGGMLPAWDARFLPEDQASLSRNTYLYSGACIGWRTPKLLRQLTNSAAKSAYRIPTITQGIAGDTLTVIAPIANDTVTVGEITYKFVNIPTNPYDVLLGGTATKSAQALFQAINVGSSDVAVVGNNTPANPASTSANPFVGFPFALQGTTNTPGANTIILVPVTPYATMNVSAINCVPQATVGGAKFKGVIYDNVNTINMDGTAYVNIPSSLLGMGGEVVGCTAGTTVSSVLSIPLTLQAGRTYWLGFIMDTAIPLQLSSNGMIAVSNSNKYTNGPPNPFQTTSISGVTTGGTTVGSLQTRYNLGQPNWQIWGTSTTLNSNDPFNNITGTVITLQAPAFGTAFNKTPVAESTVGTRMSWASTTFTGGANQTSDTTFTGASTWLEFLDQDTDVLRTPVVDDTFQRYYFASPSVPPQYNTYDRISRGFSAFYLGVPAPPIAPALSIIGGGTPTQIGFPGSSNTNTQNIPPGNPSVILYPISTTVQCTLTDISFVVAQLPAGGSGTPTEFIGVLCASNSSGNAGDIIAFGSIQNPAGPLSAPLTVVSSFGTTPPTLLPNTQYWLGVLVIGEPSAVTPAGIQMGLSDTATQGFFGQYTVSGGSVNFPVNSSTGAQQAPSSMTANYPDLQLWADVAPGSQAIQETRAYVYTWVTAYNEEGPPSPPSLLTSFVNSTWVVGLQPPLAQDMGTIRNIVKTNIYRTMASVQGGTVFFFVGSVAATATTFIDAVTDDVVAGNLILPSTNWFGPPATLQGFISMPNGMMAGFVGNEVWFCEPYRPHAWPSQYVVTTDYPIIGLGVTGVTLVAATVNNPQTFTGVNPTTITQARIPLPEPCISRGSVLSTDNGVYYASANGLIKVGGAGTVGNITQSWFTREQWDKLTPQKFIRAVKNVSTYFAFASTGVTNGQPDNSVAQQGFTLELSEADRNSFTLWPQVGGHRIGFSPLTSPIALNIDNVLSDPWSGVAFLVAGGGIYYYDFTDQSPVITPFLWRSKKFQGPHKENFAAFRLWFDIPPGGPQSPPPQRTTVPFQEHPGITAQMTFVTGMFGVVRVIADGFYVTEREIRTSEELMRVAAAQKYSTWQLEIEGIVSVTNMKMATTVKELGLMK
jgi:hypothetical protein